MPKYDREDRVSFQKDLKIDRDMLDEEAIIQPGTYFHVSEGYALAVSRRDQKKHELEVTVATLDKDVRESMDKVTEALVKAQITREQEYQRAYREYLASCLEADRWEALRNAYRQRADMLRNLVQLYQSGYFGEATGASERRDARSRFDERRRA